jgi:hypothetical protein
MFSEEDMTLTGLAVTLMAIKHIRIVPPPGSVSYFWYYKGFNSIVLMAIANSNYEFILFDKGSEEYRTVVLSTIHHFTKH